MNTCRLGSRLLLCLAGACSPEPEPEAPGEIEIEEKDDFVLAPGPINEEELEELRAQACISWGSATEPQPLALQLVVDVSGSMNVPPEGGSTVKWHTTREALREAVTSLPSTTALGALYFPNRATERNCLNEETPCEFGPALSVDSCVNTEGMFPLAELGPTESQARADFGASLDAVNPAGGTPTFDAYLLARQYLELSVRPGPRFLLLLTDGQPTFDKGCVGSGNALDPVDEQPVVDAIARARAEAGFLTYVIGAPGSKSHAGTGADARPWLSRAALAGGTAAAGCKDPDTKPSDATGGGSNAGSVSADYCHVDLSDEADFEAGLTRALSRILGRISSCEFSLPESSASGSVDPNKINVVLHAVDGTAEVIGKAESENCTEGWVLSQDERSLRLCQDACERRQESSRTSVELLLGCESVEVVPPT